jgi:hypothetical protein
VDEAYRRRADGVKVAAAQFCTDHAAVAVDQAVGDAVHMLGKRPGSW